MIQANSPRLARWRSIAIVLAAVALLMPGTVLADPGNGHREPVDIQFLNVSDWHGQVLPLSVFGVGDVGGAAYLAAYWEADRAANPNTLTLTGGDDVGATPPVSSYFDDVPAILAERMMGIQVGAFGNHNFDAGLGRLQDQIDLAGAATDADHPGDPFVYVSANLKNRDSNISDVEDFAIFDVGGIKVGVVGITNPEAPTLVFPGNFGTMVPTSPYSAANKAKAAAKRAGAQIVVAVIHAGVRGFDSGSGEPYGELIDFANNVGGFDVIFGDHTDFQYSGVVNGQIVLENRSKGLTYAKTILTVDPGNGRVIDHSVTFVTPLSSAVTPDPDIAAMIDGYRTLLDPILGTTVGSSEVIIPRADECGQSAGRICESLVGNAVTDALRATFGTDFAITNSGGLRANLTCPVIDSATDFCPSYTPPPYPITRGQVFTVLPFGNVAVTLTVNGAELKDMLERGVSAMPGADGRFAQVSGLCFTYDINASVGSRVTGAVYQAGDGTCTGGAVDLTAGTDYTIASNDFTISGGDGYPNYSSRMTTYDFLDQITSDWISANSPIHPLIQGRITCTSSGAAVCPTPI